MKRPLAYITAHYCRALYDAGFSPVCPLLFLPLFLNDKIPQEHKDGIDMARDLLRRSHVLVVCGDTVDEDMKNDIAERLRITTTTLDGILTVKARAGRKEETSMGKTIGELIEEKRIQAGAQNYKGHDYMELMRFDEHMRHMIIFDVLFRDSPVGFKGKRMRLFLTDAGYQKAQKNQAKGHIKILNHAKVIRGDLVYDHKDRVR